MHFEKTVKDRILISYEYDNWMAHCPIYLNCICCNIDAKSQSEVYLAKLLTNEKRGNVTSSQSQVRKLSSRLIKIAFSVTRVFTNT